MHRRSVEGGSASIRIIRPIRRRRSDERETDKEVEDCVCDKGVEEPRILHQVEVSAPLR